MTNLITLCASCNIKVNNRRPFWQIFFEKKLATVVTLGTVIVTLI